MSYLAELRESWRPLVGATIGLGSGMSVVGVVTSTIAPTLIRDAGWSKADFALVGSLALLMSFVFPFVGRLADTIGARRTALIGQVLLPLVYLAYSLIGRDLRVYVAIFAFQSLFCVTTTSTVYTRLVVQHVRKARGLALALVASGPAITGIVLSPVLNGFVEAHGWRAAYQAVALFTAVAGLIAFLLIPSDNAASDHTGDWPKRRARDDYPRIFRMPAFWILLGAMLLCNLPQTIMLVQLKLLLLANGVPGTGAAVMLSVASAGMLAGRLMTGLALDRWRTALVSLAGLGLPSVGLFLFASSLDTAPVLTIAVFAIGFATGAEGDIVAFLVARHFGVGVYGSTMGLLTAAMSFSTASGAAILSFTLARTGDYNVFLVVAGVCVILGAALTLLLDDGTEPSRRDKEIEETIARPGVALTG